MKKWPPRATSATVTAAALGIAIAWIATTPTGAVRAASAGPAEPPFARLVDPGDGARSAAGEDGADVSVTGPTQGIEDEPTIVVDPVDPSRAIVAAQRLTGPCVYYESSDGGTSWSAPLYAPLTPGSVICYDIAARASPDGRFFYISYLSLTDVTRDDVVVLRITTDFSETRGPFVAIGHRFGLIDKDWIDVHGVDPTHASEVYVTATYFHQGGPCTILLVRSSNYGVTWSNPSRLAKYSGCSFTNVEGLGARPLGGLGTTVLVCWYGTGTDGWGPEHGGGGTFDILCRSSADDGVTFGPLVFVVKGEAYELPYYTCPSDRYQRIWSSMLPALAIAPDGSAHLTYARDPSSGNSGGECGEVRYARSAGAPYDVWTKAATIAGGANAPSFSAITASAGQEGVCRLDVAYVDGRNSRPGKLNRRYDVYRTSSMDCGSTWGAAERVSDVSSRADGDFIGDYIDIATAGGQVRVVWTDRRNVRHVSDQGSDIYTDQWPV
jgi:hypothetical protein